MKYIIALIILYWIAEKLEISRQENKRKRYINAVNAQKEFERQQKEAEKARILEEKQLIKEAKETEKAEKEAVKQAEKARKEHNKKMLAGSDLEYYTRRERQIDNIIEILEEKQAGTIYGGKEWLKYEKQIMTYENQNRTLARKHLIAIQTREA